MRNALRMVVAAVLPLSAAIVKAPTAFAEDRQCPGTLSAGMFDNIVVPAGVNCSINDSIIKGSLRILPGAGIVDVRTTEIGGNVQGDSFNSFDLHASIVQGSVQLKQHQTNVQVCNTRVAGDLRVEEGRGGRIEIGNPPSCAANQIGGSVRIEKNTITTQSWVSANRVASDLRVLDNRGPISIIANQVGETLLCLNNAPAPTGSGNTANRKEGQCSAL
jgi:hypothetical protein